MWRAIFAIPSFAWLLMSLMLVFALASVFFRLSSTVPSEVFLYIIQPVAAILIALVALVPGRTLRDRIRHKNDKTLTIISLLAIWFVVYFLSGLLLTYGRNSLVSGVSSVLLNIYAFGLTAFTIEYVRRTILLLVGRKHIKWIAAFIVIVFALQQMNISQLFVNSSLEDMIKIIVAEVLPAIASSMLLTYLAFTCGFGAQLAYRLGVVAIMIIPPIIPKYDWYLIGVTSILVAVAIYIVMDQTAQGAQPHNRARTYRRSKQAYNGMFFLSMVGLVLLMTGFFTYKPIAIMSNSMKPVFSKGSMVIVQKINDPLDISIGDIVQYQSDGIMITHRVIDIENTANDSDERVFITQGDNSPSKDKPVRQSQIIGTVRSSIPYVGYPTVWLRELTT